MITIDRNMLVTLLAFLGLLAVPMAIAASKPFSTEMSLAPIIVVVELLIYFIVTMALNPRATIAMAAGTAVVFTITRMLLSLIGGTVAGFINVGEVAQHFATPWINPLGAFIQVLILLTSGPYILALAAPGLVGFKEAEELLGSGSKERKGGVRGDHSHDSNPTGGFIQVFSFDELTAQFKKNPGLEGFVIYNEEGLVVWKDFPLKLNIEELTSQLMVKTEQLSQVTYNGGLSRVQRIILQNRDHYLMTATLNQNFGLMVMFNSRTSVNEVTARIDIIVKTAREFLQWKYPSLPLSTGMTRDQIPLEQH
jgi:predicted regulator of Ras-like GTPase activity (Roadblock/LC7/MglB family)